MRRAISLPRTHLALLSGEAHGIGPAAARIGLWLLSLPYGIGTGARNALFDLGWKRIVRAGVPVVSVGNLTVGGTGKTPCVEYIARYLRERELRVAILSRGYGSVGGPDRTPNDEALVLEENLPDVPHYQGPDRAEMARRALEESESELLVLDDAFQHRQMARDLDIVLIDATNPWGFGHLLPRGLLREPARNLRRASLVMLTRCDQVSAEQRDAIRGQVRRLAPRVGIVETVHRPVEWVNSEGQTAPLEMASQRPLAAFCGIGNPDAFRRTLESLGTKPAAFRVYPDHHAYTRSDVHELHAWAREQPGDAFIATTQKDLVKLRLTALGSRPLWALRIALQVESGEESLHRELDRVAGMVPCC